MRHISNADDSDSDGPPPLASDYSSEFSGDEGTGQPSSVLASRRVGPPWLSQQEVPAQPHGVAPRPEQGTQGSSARGQVANSEEGSRVANDNASLGDADSEESEGPPALVSDSSSSDSDQGPPLSQGIDDYDEEYFSDDPPSLASDSGSSDDEGDFDSDLDINSSRHGNRRREQEAQNRGIPGASDNMNERMRAEALAQAGVFMGGGFPPFLVQSGVRSDTATPVFFSGGMDANGAAYDFVSALSSLGEGGMLPLGELPDLFRFGGQDIMQQLLDASFNAAQTQKPKAHPYVLQWVTVFQIQEGDEIECPITAEELPPKDWAARMPCGHCFSQPSLFQWLEQSNACPTCRYELATTDHQYNSHHRLSLESPQELTKINLSMSNDVMVRRIATAKQRRLQDMMTQAWAEVTGDSGVDLQQDCAQEGMNSHAQGFTLDLDDEMIESCLIETLRWRQEELLNNIVMEDLLNSLGCDDAIAST